MSRDNASSAALKRGSVANASNTGLPPAPLPSSKDLDESSTARQNLNSKRSSRKLTRGPPLITSSDASLPVPPVPAMKVSQPSVQPKKSSGSLFSLFSKPKVEKARGYGGEGPPPLPAAKTLAPPQQPLRSALKQSSASPVSPTPATSKHGLSLPMPPPAKEATQRVPTAVSARPRVDSQSPGPRQEEREGKSADWIAPPLFQAFARSLKHGLAEVTTNAVIEKAVAARPKTSSNKEQNGRQSMDSDNSADTRKTKMTIKGTLASSSPDAQKIFVLLDDGHILQYTQHGPTNRLPEKVLALCQDSAAMTCDVGQGKPVALRIVQSVAQKSFSLSSTFSRLTRRSAAAKREATSFIIIFAESQEMDEWMRAVRTKIADLCHPESSMPTLETPSSSKVDSVIGDTKRLSQPSPAGSPPPTTATEKENATPATVLATVPERRTSLMMSPRDLSFDIDSDDSDRRNSLEMLEEEAEKLISPQALSTTESSPTKRISDSPSRASSYGTSADNTFSNTRHSNRMSETSNATGITSRTNSLTSEPSYTQENSDVLTKSPYRNLSSYQPNKRRSVLPAPTAQPDSSSSASLLAQVASMNEAPTRPSPTVLPPIASISRTPSTSSLLALTALPEVNGPELATPPILEEDERPQSILTDLPPPSTWTSKLSPKNRSSVIIQPMTERQLQRMSSVPVMRTTPAEVQNRRASQAFRIPLKVNPDSSSKRTSFVPDGSTLPPRRSSFVPDMSTGAPHVFTLEAKVDPRSQRMSMGPAAYSSAEMRARSTQRLSLFPSPLLTQDVLEQHRRPSLHGTQSATDIIPPRRASLQRPTSLQVRTDHAPFLSSVRQSPPSAEKPALSSSPPAAAPPIRSLKPSRSSSAMPTTDRRTYDMGRPASPTDPFMFNGLSMNAPSRYSSRRQSSYVSKRTPSPASAPPLAPLPMAPVIPMGNSFAQQRSSQRHSYMPRSSMTAAALDLGPPAPPPNAPLPAIPSGVAPAMNPRASLAVGAFGPRRPSVPTIVVPPRASITTEANGLGIQVGS